MKLLLCLSVCFIFQSCFKPEQLVIDKVDQIKVGNFDKNGLSVDLDVYITNKSIFNYHVEELNAYLIFENDTTGRVFLCSPLSIKGKSSCKHKICAHVPYTKALTSGMILFKSFMKDGATIKISGEIKIKTFILTIKRPIDYKTEFRQN